jgi:predicted regulator of Ras-like GTPase activity (Roadblock/LC7/MglB family)
MPWPRRPRETEGESGRESRCRTVLSKLRETLPGIKAVIILGSDGELRDSAATEPGLDASALASEYAMLLRIGERTSHDTGMGAVHEQILISSSSMVLIQHLPNGRFAIFVCAPDEHLGRLRYELRRSLLYSTLSNL